MAKKVATLASLLFQLLAAGVRSEISFLAIGDWGGQDDYPYYSTGQMDAAQSMDKVAGELNAQFFLGLGDNFYHDGVTDEGSPRFNETFESVYTGPNLQKDWYLCPGNHDYNGNVSAQVDYTGDSDRWQFPAKYHSHSFTSSDGVTVDLIMIDTVNLAGFTPLREGEPGYFDPLPELSRDYAMPQWQWIEETMAASTAQYLLVGGHYPVYSVCSHGNTPTLHVLLRPLLQQYGAHYLYGHDHCMQHSAEQNGVNHFLIGMGKECCYDAPYVNKMPEDTLKFYIANDNAPSEVTAGFTAFTATTEALNATFYDQAGNVLYATPPIPPRTSSV